MEDQAAQPYEREKPGSIWIYLGPMYSGKTTRMGMCIELAAHAKKHGVIIKYKKDTRYTGGASIRTHANFRLGANGDTESLIRVVMADTLSEVKLEPNEVVVGIDEGQFYPDLVATCEKWAKQGRWVVVAALDGDWRRRPFGNTLDLIPLAEKAEKLQAICMDCGSRAAPYTWMRKGVPPRETHTDGVEVRIGGIGQYISLCRACYYAVSPTTPSDDIGSAAELPTKDSEMANNDHVGGAVDPQLDFSSGPKLKLDHEK